MKIYTDIDVLTAAKSRMRYIYEEFDNVLIATSGGKDSTVVLELAIETAREMGKLPIRAFWLDQESEYQGTVDYMRYLKTRPEIDLWWFQVPFVLTNSVSLENDNYLHCWKPGEKWMREKEPDSIHENPYPKVTRFHKLIAKLNAYCFDEQYHAVLMGIRANESQTRMILMHKHVPAYKNIRWCSHGENGLRMYPIYDWGTKDVWKAIYEHGWEYNHVYDLMYKYGKKQTFMRVSSILHETGHWAIDGLHEMEPETYNALSQRVNGVATYHTGGQELYVPSRLPSVFSSWQEYRDYLLKHLIAEEHKAKFQNRIDKQSGELWAQQHVKEIIINDYEGVTNGNAARAIQVKEFQSQPSKQSIMDIY